MILSPENYPALPKWAGVYITGESVTPEQAKEIIFRTDTSLAYPSGYGMGNDRRFAQRCIDTFGWRQLLKLEEVVIRQTSGKVNHGPLDPWEIRDQWRAEMGMISTEFVHNTWLASSYIYGPYGWCSPQGKIHSDGHNFGKYPSVESVARDWQVLLEAFPFIKVHCTLFSGEYCEDHAVPVCTIVVDGEVQVCAPDLTLHHSAPTMGEERDEMGVFSRIAIGDYRHERGWPPDWIEEFGRLSTAAMKKVAPRL